MHHLCCAFLAIAIFTLVSAAHAEEKPMMKAVVAHEYGAPDVLKFEEVPRPEPQNDEALVRVIASSVNPADPLTLSGKYAKEFGTHLPLIPGYDIDRKSVVYGKSVDLGGRRIIKKKKKNTHELRVNKDGYTACTLDSYTSDASP